MNQEYSINKMLNDSIKKEEYINNAFNYVYQYHSMEYITGKYIGLMNSLK